MYEDSPTHWSATDCRGRRSRQKDLLPYRAQRARPYIYSEEDIQKLLNAASQVPSKNGLRPKTYYYILGLLSVTGLRISEALNLDRADVDFDESMLIVRKTKFGKNPTGAAAYFSHFGPFRLRKLSRCSPAKAGVLTLLFLTTRDDMFGKQRSREHSQNYLERLDCGDGTTAEAHGCTTSGTVSRFTL